MAVFTRKLPLAAACALLAAAALLATAPTASSDPPCGVTWDGGPAGNWGVAANWSGDVVPNNTSDVCITGNVTVVMRDADNNPAAFGVRSLTLGGAAGSGNATIVIQGGPRVSVAPPSARIASLTLEGESLVNPSGTIRLLNTGTSTSGTEQAILAMPQAATHQLTNHGSIVTEGPAVGDRMFQGLDITNAADGTVAINTSAAEVEGGKWINHGAMNVASGQGFFMQGPGAGPTFTQAAGAIANNGSFRLDLGTFNVTGGTVSGGSADPEVCGTTLSPTGGSGTIVSVRDASPGHGCHTSHLAGDVGANLTIRVRNTYDDSGVSALSLAANRTNAGTISLEGTKDVRILGGQNTLTNTGTITTSGSGNRAFELHVVNAATGQVSVGQDTCQCGYTFQSAGNVTAAAGETFSINTVFTQTGGNLGGAGTLFMNGGTFTHTAGTTTSPPQLCGSALNPGGSGTAVFEFVRENTSGCANSNLNGNIAASETVRIKNSDPNQSNGVFVSVGQNMTNAGTLEMVGTGKEQLIGGRTITNTGTFRTSGSGERLIHQTVNTGGSGHVAIDADTCVAACGWGGQWSLSGGTMAIAAGDELNVSQVNVVGGALSGSGAVAGNVANSGGEVRPGTSPGTLTVTGDYTQGAGGTLRSEVEGGAPGTGYDRLAVGGTATLGGTLVVDGAGFTPSDSDTFDVVTAATRNGQFATTNGLSSAGGGKSFTVTYPPGKVTLTVNPPPDSDADGSPDHADCDDANAGIRPGANDVPGNGVDEDCSGADAQSPGPGPGPADADGDGVPDASDPAPNDPAIPTRFGADHGNNTLSGTAAGETICGLLGNDVVNAFGGDDTVFGDLCGAKVRTSASAAQAGAGGNDTLHGGAGNDTLYGAGGNDRLFGEAGLDRLFGGGGSDALAGGDGNDSLTGSTGKDALDGGRADDRLAGGDGNDTLSGGAGRDALDGGKGNDRLKGGAGANSYRGGPGNDTITARNRKRDKVDCGAGRKDSASVDRVDTVRGCEKVRRAR